MFDIAFLSAEPEPQEVDPGEDEWFAKRGLIVLGDYREEFLAALGPWTVADYERQWIEAAHRIVSGMFDTTAFVTSAWQFMWPMWREGDDVFAQETLLLNETEAPFDPAHPYAQIGQHVRDTEPSGEPGDPLYFDGRISEWRITVEDLRAFIDRRTASEA